MATAGRERSASTTVPGLESGARYTARTTLREEAQWKNAGEQKGSWNKDLKRIVHVLAGGTPQQLGRRGGFSFCLLDDIPCLHFLWLYKPLFNSSDMLDPVSVAHRVGSALRIRRRRDEEPTTGAFHDMVAVTLCTVNAPLRSAFNDAATTARIDDSGESEAGDNAGPHSAGHGGSGEGGEANVNAASPSDSGRMEGHAHTDGRGGNDGPPGQFFTIVINMTNTGGPGGPGLSDGGRGGDGGGASMLDVPPPTGYSIHSTDVASLGRDGATGEGSAIGIHAVQEQVVTTSPSTPHPLLAHPARIVDEHSAPGEGTVIDVHEQTTTTSSIGICSTPPPLPVDDAALGTVAGHGETGEGLIVGVQAQVVTTATSIGICSTSPPLPVDDVSLGTVGRQGESGGGSVIGVQAQTTTTGSIGFRSTPRPLPPHPARFVDDAAQGTARGHGETGEGPAISV
ncbi:hypothetical protein C8J57DRAFT_1222047 [Mycena rebaudengoi]|nr:hypothetical protein C8J57DRAFT_1222047 [Mycena rebaudengoi]